MSLKKRLRASNQNDIIKKLDYILDKNFKKKTFFIISIIFFSTILEVVGISLVIPFF